MIPLLLGRAFVARHAFRGARHSCRFLTGPTSTTREVYLEDLKVAVPGVAAVCLNRPEARNAISKRLVKELHECLDEAAANKELRVLILRSTSGGAFCAGADLAERRSMGAGEVDAFLRALRGALGKLEGLPVPTVAAIDGAALGGGLEMCLACDLRVAGRNVKKIGLPETSLGIIPGAGGTQRAVRILGVSKAKDLIFTARALTAVEAHEFGLVDHLSEGESTGFDRAVELACVMASNAPLALRAAKQALSRAQDLSLESGLDWERVSYERLLSSKDRLEALKAFQEKRRPQFKGE